MILTGRMMDAAEAERSGLVSRVVPAASLIEEALKTAETIASMSRAAVFAAKESVNRAYETTLAEGIRFERRIFHALFATEDQKEGMKAFVEKRPAASSTGEPCSRARLKRWGGADGGDRRRVSPKAEDPSSLAERSFRRQSPEVGAGCGNSARPDLCGGRSETGVPTANTVTERCRRPV